MPGTLRIVWRASRYPGLVARSPSNSIHSAEESTNRPLAGRFLTEDPVGFVGGVNFYDYVRSNPINRIDPRGLWGVFGFGALTAATPTPGIRAAGEAVGLVGYNSNDGASAGVILAGGV